jgi:NCS1 family nucleobase:cation symporter-1
MARYLQQAKATFGSPTTFKDALQTTNGNGKVRYNQDLLPSPPGQFPSIHI